MRQYYLPENEPLPLTEESLVQKLIQLGDIFPIKEAKKFQSSWIIYPTNKKDKGVVLRKHNPTGTNPGRIPPTLYTLKPDQENL